jgi:uncharacterized protein
MRIAVLADTHDHCPPGLPERMESADEIWHLGDVCDPRVLAAFEAVGPRVRVVRGNCDWHTGWAEEIRWEHEGYRFLLVHVPPRRAPAGTQVILHGHTHVARDETDAQGVRWLNPGCISRPRSGGPPSFAWLGIRAGRIDWKVVPV